MNNSINSINSYNNVSFNSRYIKFRTEAEEFPQQIRDAIYNNSAIDEFIKAGNPKTLFGKFIDFFKKDECLEVLYDVEKSNSFDPYNKSETILFSLLKGGKVEKSFPIQATQYGIIRQAGSIPKPGEHYIYKPPIKTATDSLIRQIRRITDLDKFFEYFENVLIL